MNRARPILLLAIASGYWVLVFETWSWPYKANLVFHPLAGLAATLAVGFLLARRRLPGVDARAWTRAVLPGAGLALFLGWLRTRTGSGVADWLLVASGAALAARRVKRSKTEFLARCALFFLAAVAMTGLVFGLAGGGRAVKHFLLLHRAASHALVLALVLWSPALVRSMREAAAASSRPARAAGRLATGALALGILALVASELLQARNDPYYRFHLSTYALERRGPTEQDILPADFTEPELATKTESCGQVAGCHPNLVADQAVSAHGRSMFTGYIQKNMALLAEEIGEHNQITCGGCHYSRMMFERDRKLADSYHEVNYSCTFCHQIADVRLWEDRRKTDLGVRLHVRHLRMFHAGGRDAIGELDRRLINLNPFGHARVFRKPLYFRNEYCQVCHRLQIAATPETPLAAPLCIDCHMQPRRLLGLEGDERNHIMPGTNTAIPADLGDEAGVELVRRYAAGLLPVPIKGWGSFWEPRDRQSGRSIWVHQKALPASEPIPGRDFTLRILTINASIDHVFPGGPLDLVETWQRVVVRDQEERVLFRVGDLDERHYVDPAAHRMGGYMMGEDGKPVERNRVWQIREKIVERAIPFHQSTSDDYTFHLPEGTTELRIESQWLYRKLNQAFMDWAYPGEGKTVPVVVAAEMKATMPIR